MKQHSRNLKCMLLKESSQSKKDTYRMVPTLTFWKGKTIETAKNSLVARGWGKRGVNRQSTENFRGNKSPLYKAVIVNTWHYKLVQSHRMCNIPRVHPNGSCALWIMRCRCRFINCNACSTLIGDADSGGDCSRAEAGGMGKSLHLLLNFAVNLKLL